MDGTGYEVLLRVGDDWDSWPRAGTESNLPESEIADRLPKQERKRRRRAPPAEQDPWTDQEQRQKRRASAARTFHSGRWPQMRQGNQKKGYEIGKATGGLFRNGDSRHNASQRTRARETVHARQAESTSTRSSGLTRVEPRNSYGRI